MSHQPKLSTFRSSLAPGDLVLATRLNSGRLHVVRLGKSKHDLEGHKPDRADPERRLWDGRALCPVKSTYYFSPRVGSPRDACPACLAKWRAAGRPAIKGATDETGSTSSAWPLPFGWREVEIAGHPWDVPAGGDPDRIRDGTGKSVGELRVERARWCRGDRVVRLVEYLDETGYGVLHHDAGEPLKEEWWVRGNQEHCMKKSWELMAIGGTP